MHSIWGKAPIDDCEFNYSIQNIEVEIFSSITSIIGVVFFLFKGLKCTSSIRALWLIASFTFSQSFCFHSSLKEVFLFLDQWSVIVLFFAVRYHLPTYKPAFIDWLAFACFTVLLLCSHEMAAFAYLPSLAWSLFYTLNYLTPNACFIGLIGGAFLFVSEYFSKNSLCHMLPDLPFHAVWHLFAIVSVRNWIQCVQKQCNIYNKKFFVKNK